MNAAPDAATAKTVEILMVEDSVTQAMLLGKILEKHNFHPRVARNGRLGLEEVREKRPTMVITDVQMPEMDGYELCATIKNDPALHDVPVMLLTSLSAPQDIIRGLECGADNFVVKPYEEGFLVSRIETILANQKLRKASGPEAEIPIYFAGQKYVITSDRRQILNLLLTSYETAVKTNEDLIKAHEELKAAQAQLIEMEKLQSIARLSAGVAHEVRNPLAILEMGITFLAEKNESEDDGVIIDQMKEAVSRANTVITSLMDLSSARGMGMQEAGLAGIIEGALAAYGNELAQRNIQVHRELGADECLCRVDAAKMEQAFLNVIANACDAMADRGGTLTVRTRAKPLEKREAMSFNAGDRSGARLREGDRVVIAEIADTGGGIAPENLSKLYDPFFSTKPTGKGMGLGLTVAKKIIDVHGGSIEVANRDDHSPGTRVRIVLRCAAASVRPAAGP